MSKGLIASIAKGVIGASILGAGIGVYKLYKSSIEDAYSDGFQEGFEVAYDNSYGEDEEEEDIFEDTDDLAEKFNSAEGEEDIFEGDEGDIFEDADDKLAQAREKVDEEVEKLMETLKESAQQLKAYFEDFTGKEISESDMKEALKSIIEDNKLLDEENKDKLKQFGKDLVKDVKEFTSKTRETLGRPLTPEEVEKLEAKTGGIIRGKENGKAYIDWNRVESKTYKQLNKALTKIQSMVDSKIQEEEAEDK